MKTVTYKPKSTTLEPTISRQRKRTERHAIELVERSVLIPASRRKYVRDRIRNAKQPKSEANRLIRRLQGELVEGVFSNDNYLDLSDVQELRVKLIRRDRGIWPPHSDYLTKMEYMILDGSMTPKVFKEMSGLALNRKRFPPTGPKQDKKVGYK